MALCSLSTRAVSRTTRAASSFVALYSTVTGLAALRNWGVTGPAPVSAVSDEGTTSVTQKPASVKPRAKTARDSTPAEHRAHRERMKAQFPEGWLPPRRLSRQAMDGLRLMHAQQPDTFSTPVLAEAFKISPEAVRRILKSKWEPTKEKKMHLMRREQLERQQYIAGRREEERRRQMDILRQQQAGQQGDR